jgi:guanylate cyclase
MNNAKSSLTRNFLQKAISLIARIGADPSDSDEVRLKKTILVVPVFSVIFVLTVMGLLHVVLGEPLAGMLFLTYVAIMFFSLILFGLMRKGFNLFSLSIIALALIGPCLIELILGGFANSAGYVLYGLLAPLGALILYGPRPAFYWFLAYASLVIAIIPLQPYLRPANNLPPAVSTVLFGANIAFVASFVFGILIYFIGQRDLAFRLLRGEQEKSENLLLNILPKEIATILKNESRTIADHYDGASILFADVVNFTPMSVQMTPVELVELLNEVFSHFDTLVEKYSLEKIKTIGDCYMVAAGVPRPRPDHAQVLARMALEMQGYVGGREFRGKRLAFRIGINSGPVVAGVIGRKKFIYDLWGDAVNTASRMESHGTGGAIQITRATYELIKDDFICEPRGTVAVKGKGEMEVWHVVGSKT